MGMYLHRLRGGSRPSLAPALMDFDLQLWWVSKASHPTHQCLSTEVQNGHLEI